MADLQSIVKAYGEAKRGHGAAATATVIRVVGSSYRRPGARMLIYDNGTTFGTVSGGCLERDLALRAQEVITSRTPTIFQYSTTGSDDDVLFGVGAGCNGSVDIFVEPIGTSGREDPLEKLASCASDRMETELATVVKVEGNVPARPGDKISFADGAIFSSTIEEPRLVSAILEKVHEQTSNDHSLVAFDFPIDSTETAGSARIEIFIEFVQPPVLLVIFGAGQEALPMIRIAKLLGWDIIVADHRPKLAAQNRFPLSDKVVRGGPATVLGGLKSTRRVAAVLMSHNYAHDLDCLKELNSFSLDYIGLLGPKQRTMRLMQELAGAGASVSSSQKQNLFSPIGLDIGAETEEEIALSIVAEVQSIMSHRPGTPLRHRDGSIHSDSARTRTCRL